MNKLAKLAVGATMVAGMVVGGGGISVAGTAQWGETQPTYCSSSTGCYMVNGKPVRTTVGPVLTAREKQLQSECNLRLAGTAFAGAGGIMSSNWMAIIGAAFNGGSALTGPCKTLWDSTKRFRV